MTLISLLMNFSHVNMMWFPFLLVLTLGSLIMVDNIILLRNESLPTVGLCILGGMGNL